MMLEQSLISPNFLGKESFRWFIGVITDNVDVNGDGVGGYRVQVRIIGYHPELKSIIDDNELPWAHVLVPLTMGTGTWGNGAYRLPSGGTTVIGFFMDGDNGQQPVIIGGLFSGYNIKYDNSYEEGTNNFKPAKRKTAPFNRNHYDIKTGKSTNSNGGTPTPDSSGKICTPGDGGKAKEGKTQGESNRITDGTLVTIPPQCKSSKSTYSKILQVLRKFVKVLRTVQQVGDQFINPALNTITNIPSLLEEVSVAISDLLSDYIRYIRKEVIKAVYKWLKDNVIDKIFGKDAKLIKQLATDKVVDSIWCAFKKILNGLVNFVKDFLTQIINKVINFPFCAVESLVGSVLSTVTNQINEAIGPALQEFSSAVGGAIGDVLGYVSQAISYASAAVQFLSCEGAECKEALNYEMNKGYISDIDISNFKRALGAPSRGIQDAKTAAEDWLGINSGENDSEFGSCDATSLVCGLPTIEFFGGGGFGAAGEAVVDSLGQVIGVNMTDFGFGYTNAPYVSIVDACDTGGGAYGTAIVQDGKVTGVYMEETGSDYIAPIIQDGETSCTTNPITTSGSEVLGFITGIEILRTGIGYQSSDLITDSACDSDVEIYPVVDSDGRIIGTKIVNPGSAIRVFPELIINTTNGEGAILRPILSFKPVEESTIQSNIMKIEKVILCAENHG